MKTRLLAAVAAMAFATCALATSPTTLTLQPGGTTVPASTPIGGASITNLELDPAMSAGDSDSGNGLGLQNLLNRSIAQGHAGSNSKANGNRAKSNPELLGGFD